MFSLARFFLFGARAVWCVVALPVFLQTALGWQYWQVGGFMGLWVIGLRHHPGFGPGHAAQLGPKRTPKRFCRAVLPCSFGVPC